MTTTAPDRGDDDVARLDPDVAERLRCVVDALGGARLPLRVVVRALLLEAADRLAADVPRER